MKTLDEFRRKSILAPDCLDAPTLYLDEEEQVGAAVSGLIEYFGENDTRLGVNLVIRGEMAGFLPRQAIYDSVSFSSKGLGDGDFSNLPGLPEYGLLILHCPEPGCTWQCLVTYFRPSDTPSCKIHPSKRMELHS